jgi:hypothetical protein
MVTKKTDQAARPFFGLDFLLFSLNPHRFESPLVVSPFAKGRQLCGQIVQYQEEGFQHY